jgi:DNA end-binding protein Ku
LTFGLVSVPVNLFPAARANRASLRMLGPEGRPLARRYFAEKTGKDLDADAIVRGYEIKKDKYVIVTDEELERLQPEKTRDINLTQFVPADSIPPLYFERGYFLTPSGGSQKAYKLLAETMDKSELAGIATFVMRGKEYLVAIFSEHGILRAETMRFQDEIRSPADVGLPKKKAPTKATVSKFEKLIANKSKKQFAPSKLADKQTDDLLRLVKKKQSKRGNVVTVDTEAADSDQKVIDLVAVLKKSLGAKK